MRSKRLSIRAYRRLGVDLNLEHVVVASDGRVPVVASVRKHELAVPQFERTHATGESAPITSRVVVFEQLMRPVSMGCWIKSPAALVCSYIPTAITIAGVFNMRDPTKIVEEIVSTLSTARVRPDAMRPRERRRRQDSESRPKRLPRPRSNSVVQVPLQRCSETAHINQTAQILVLSRKTREGGKGHPVAVRRLILETVDHRFPTRTTTFS